MTYRQERPRIKRLSDGTIEFYGTRGIITRSDSEFPFYALEEARDSGDITPDKYDHFLTILEKNTGWKNKESRTELIVQHRDLERADSMLDSQRIQLSEIRKKTNRFAI